MMKYWKLTWEETMNMMYINAMMLNACIPSYDDKGSGSKSPADRISLFDLGKQLSG